MVANIKIKRLVLIVSLLCLCTKLLVATVDDVRWKEINERPVPEWWSDAKFGVFIHWGLYSVPAYAQKEGPGSYRYSEWYDSHLRKGTESFVKHHEKYYGGSSYANFVADFKAEHFDPKQWAKLLKDSGAKYVVLTSKHHDGYALWPSKHSPRWNSKVLGPNRDLLGELTEAVKEEGLQMGFYYSLLEWGNPLYAKETIDRWTNEMNIPQMKELVEQYQPAVLWTDGEWDFSPEELGSHDFLTWLFNESDVKDTIVVNDRWGKGARGHLGGHYTTEYGRTYSSRPDEELFIHPWEECRGIGYSFGFNQFETMEDYMSADECIHTLVDVVSRGGNLLLNIGPDAKGIIPVLFQERLLKMGKWLDVNGEAIYGSRAWGGRPEGMAEQGIYFTRKDDALYVICTQWPSGTIELEGVTGVEGVTLLGSEAPVNYLVNGQGLQIQPPRLTVNELPCEHAWVFRVNLAQQ